MAFIPLKDYNPLQRIRFQTVTVMLIAASVAVFLWQSSLPEGEARNAIYALGLVPSVLFGTETLPDGVALVAPEITILTSMFLHGGWMHLIGNMLYLWIFGDNIEDAMGHGRFLVFYLLCGTAAALSQAAMASDSTIPMVGASGAISGVLGAYILLHPRTKVLVALIGRLLVTLPAVTVLGLWILLQFVSASLDDGAGGGTAWWAHIGGFVAGLILIIPMRDRSVPLFDRAPHSPGDPPPGAPPPRWSLRGRTGRGSRFPDSGGRNL
jgi:membrane associated rhomboid family serine protease